MKKLILIFGLLSSSLCYSQIDTSIYLKQMEMQQRQQVQNNQSMKELGDTIGLIRKKRQLQKRQELYNDELNTITSNLSDITFDKLSYLLGKYPEFSEQIQQLSNLLVAKAQIAKINSETQLVLSRAAAPPSMTKTTSNNKEERVYVEHIEDNLYKTNDNRLIKTRSCYEYVYGEKATIIQNELIFKNSKTCDIEKIISL